MDLLSGQDEIRLDSLGASTIHFVKVLLEARGLPGAKWKQSRSLLLSRSTAGSAWSSGTDHGKRI